MLSLLAFWLACQLMAFAVLGIARWVFPELKDRGYGATKFFGLLVVGWVVWMLGSLHILPYRWLTIALVLVLLAVASFLIVWKEWADVLFFFRRHKTYVAIVEVLFLFGLLFYGWMRAYQPDITGTEKLPDFSFLSGCLKSDYFPPMDPWFSGGRVNYYYFGHYLMSVVTKATGAVPQVAFNCAIALLFALVVTLSYAFVFNITGRVWESLLGPFFVAVIGNLDGFYQYFFELRPGEGFNWWLPSRVIVKSVWRNGAWAEVDSTINEFPYWSFLLGDMHAHLLAAPLMILNIMVLLSLIQGREGGLRWFGKGWPRGVLLAGAFISFGAISPTNTWEVPGYVVLVLAAVLWSHYSVAERISLKGVGFAFLSYGILLAGAFVAYLPFHWQFVPLAQGFKWVLPEARTHVGHFMAVWGFFMFLLMFYLFFRLREEWRNRAYALPFAMSVAAAVVVMILWGNVMIPFVTFLVAGYMYVALKKEHSAAWVLLFMVAVLGLCQILGTEFISIDDAFGGSLERMNTVFKFYFSSWIFFGLAGACLCLETVRRFLRQEHPVWMASWGGFFAAGIFAVMVYTLVGPWAKTNHFLASGHIPTLDGIAYMQGHGFPDDYAAIQWLQEHVAGTPVLAEASGPPFSHHGRISAATGVPCPLGWEHHEDLWRRPTGVDIHGRAVDLGRLYNTQDVNELKALVHKYGIEYVYVGNLEKKNFQAAGLSKFDGLFPVMVDEGGGKLYEIPKEF